MTKFTPANFASGQTETTSLKGIELVLSLNSKTGHYQITSVIYENDSCIIQDFTSLSAAYKHYNKLKRIAERRDYNNASQVY